MNLFVSGPPTWAFTRQHVWNNHPVFSFLESIVFDLVGGGEVAMRLAPVGFAAAAVALLCWRVTAAWGIGAGIASGSILAVHPMIVPLARDARGYSLAVLAIVVMGVAVFDRHSPWLFGAGAAVGLGTHLYVAPVVLILVAWQLMTGRLDRRWRNALGAALLAAGVIYSGMAQQMGRGTGRHFRPLWPRDAAWELLGGGAVTLALSLVLLALAARWAPTSRAAAFVAAMAFAAVVVPWLIAPPDLYPRFLYWMVPGLAVAVAWAVHHAPWTLAVVGALSMAMLIPQLDSWTGDQIPNRELARRAGDEACIATWPAEALIWYLNEYAVGTDCAAGAILLPEETPESANAVADAWPTVCWAVAGAELRAVEPASCP